MNVVNGDTGTLSINQSLNFVCMQGCNSQMGTDSLLCSQMVDISPGNS